MLQDMPRPSLALRPAVDRIARVLLLADKIHSIPLGRNVRRRYPSAAKRQASQGTRVRLQASHYSVWLCRLSAKRAAVQRCNSSTHLRTNAIPPNDDLNIM